MGELPSVRVEVENAARTLRMAASAFRIVDRAESKAILESIVRAFVTRADARWWWAFFRSELDCAARLFQGEREFELLPNICPSAENVWFVVEETYEGFLLCEGTVSDVSRIIAECYGFEYSLVAKDLSWLVCWNHEEALFALGKAAQWLRDFVARERPSDP